MMATGVMSQAVVSTSLVGIMNVAEIGIVPAGVVAGNQLRYDVESCDREFPEPLVRSTHVELNVESIDGYRQSGAEGARAPSVALQRDWLEMGNLYKEWSGLQGAANRVAGVEVDDVESEVRIASNDFELALLNQALNTSVGSVAARTLYENVAIRYEVERNFTAAAMVWERAATNLDHPMPEVYGRIHHGRAAKAWYQSLPRHRVDYDPVSLRFARGIWHAYGSDEKFHRMLLMRSVKFKELREMPFEAGADRLRIACSVLNGESMLRSSWGTVFRMLGSAAALFEGLDGVGINTDMLMELAAEAKRHSSST